jgi:hypothetical protein
MNLSSKGKLAVLMTSTPLMPEDLCEKIENDIAWKTTKYPAIIKWPKDIIDNPGSLLVTRESNLADYSRGDVLIWGATDKNKYGHVAILVAVYNTKWFIVLEQDGFKQDGVKLAFRSRENLLGCLYKLENS